MRRLLPLLCLPLLSGCFLSNSQVNQGLDVTAYAQLEPGKTSAGEVVQLLGAPTEVVQLGKRSAYRYDHTRTKQAGLWLILVFLSGTDTQSDRAWVFFDESDVLSHVGTTFDAGLSKFAVPPLKLSEK
jgi:outer membrane protein assembly factor BamE (lipoprotein component of BamABCDE complex)